MAIIILLNNIIRYEFHNQSSIEIYIYICLYKKITNKIQCVKQR